jgi:hypothetical protein
VTELTLANGKKRGTRDSNTACEKHPQTALPSALLGEWKRYREKKLKRKDSCEIPHRYVSISWFLKGLRE